MSTRWRATFIVPSFAIVLAATFGTIGYLLDSVLGIPARLHMPWAVRSGGIMVLGLGLGILGWLSKYRKPGDVLVSTYVTFRKFVLGTAWEEPTGRTEPLVLQGPQRYVRNPMYFAVVVLWLGWWLVLDYTFLLWMAVFFFVWFHLVVIPFEERELRALYGKEFEAYVKAVPKFFPAWPRGRREEDDV
jgi:protein-S-isoprenylcysteine O-methyltransferase Ste14